MSEYVEITPTEIEVARIERDTGIYTPSFISDLPAIDPIAARDFAVANDLIEWKRAYERQDLLDFYGSIAGLSYCRVRGLTLEKAAETIKDERSFTAEDLFQHFSIDRYNTVKENVMNLEQQRREKRDSELFKLEMSFLNKRDIKLNGHVTSLHEYGEYLSQQEKKKNKRDVTPNEVYWDMMAHYSKLIEGVQHGFEPLTEWRQYLEGNQSILGPDHWHLSNVGDNDLSYFDMTQKWPIVMDRPRKIDYDSNLLFHCTSLNAANNIVQSGYLHPRVCYGAGQVLTSARYDVAFIFKKTDITNTYSALPYVESMGTHEQEVRSNEQNSINLCIGCVPMDSSIFPDVYDEGWYYPEHPAGRLTSAQWEKNLQDTGRLWTEEDIQEIENALHKKNPLQ